MASSPSPTSLRSIFEKFATEAEVACAESRTRARYEIAQQLNQATRRLRHSRSVEELGLTLTDVASAFTGGLALFYVEGEKAVAKQFTLEIPLSAAPGFGAALDSGDPVVAASTASEIPPEVPQRFGHEAGDRVWIFPVQAGKRAGALLYCWGDVAVPVVELYTQVAGGVWLGLLPRETQAPAAVASAPELVSIASAPAASAPPPAPAPPRPAAPSKAASWDELPSAEQQIHLRAQRFARVHASTMRLNEPGAVAAGRLHHNLYEMLRSPIDQARDSYRKDFFTTCPSMVDYLHLEIVHTLANDDAELLGPEYPGPLV